MTGPGIHRPVPRSHNPIRRSPALATHTVRPIAHIHRTDPAVDQHRTAYYPAHQKALAHIDFQGLWQANRIRFAIEAPVPQAHPMHPMAVALVQEAVRDESVAQRHAEWALSVALRSAGSHGMGHHGQWAATGCCGPCAVHSSTASVAV